MNYSSNQILNLATSFVFVTAWTISTPGWLQKVLYCIYSTMSFSIYVTPSHQHYLV